MTAVTVSAADLDAIVREHLDAYPDHDHRQVFQAIRDAGEVWASTMAVYDAYRKARPTPTLTTVAEARDLLDHLAGKYQWVSVFADRCWGDKALDVSIIVEGNGSTPFAELDRDLYRQLVAERVVGPDTYGGFKARRLHDYTCEGES